MDGASFRVKRDLEDKFYEACNNFYNNVIDIEQEFAYYKKCYIRDVNNYLIIKDDGGVKRKGFFELPQDQLPHKNNSYGIIPIAIDRYWVEGIPVRDTIENHLFSKGYRKYIKSKEEKYEIECNGIYDFCKGVKAKKSPKKGKSHYVFTTVKNGKIHEERLQKVNRFYICNKGGKIIKKYEDNSSQQVVADKVYTKVVNNIDSNTSKNPDINFEWYIKEAEDAIRQIDPNYNTIKQMRQMTMF